MHVSFDWIITRLCFSKHKTPNLIYIFNLIFKIHVPLFFIWVITINRLIKIELDVILCSACDNSKEGVDILLFQNARWKTTLKKYTLWKKNAIKKNAEVRHRPLMRKKSSLVASSSKLQGFIGVWVVNKSTIRSLKF